MWACDHHILFPYRQPGQDTIDELRSRDFRRELEERERQAARERAKERGGRSSAADTSKRPRLEQLPTNLDADDPVDDDDDDDSDERYRAVHGQHFPVYKINEASETSTLTYLE